MEEFVEFEVVVEVGSEGFFGVYLVLVVVVYVNVGEEVELVF